MNLLIVDDTPTDLKLLRAQLEAEGHVVFEAHDGVDALALLERQRVDAVISDVLMPRMDGYQLCHEIRKHTRHCDLPIIIYTATFTSPGDEKLALDTGADKYLKKPASIKTIITALHEVIAQPHAAPRPEALQKIEVLKEYSERLVSKLEKKNTELQAAEGKFRALVEQSIVGIYIIQDDRFVYVNPTMAGIFGRSEEEMTSRTVYDFLVPEDHALARENLRKRTSNGAPSIHYHLRVLHQSGAVLQVEVHSSRADYNGRPAVMGTLLNITERKRSEEALHLQSTALTAAANAILIANRDGTIVWVNPAFTTLTGYTLAEAVGKNSRDLVKSGEHDAAFFKHLWTTILAGQIWKSETVNRRKDGTLYTEFQTITPVKNEQGEITHFIAIKEDITARKQSEARISEQAEIIDRSPLLITISNILGEVTYFSGGALRLLGMKKEDVLGRKPEDLFPPETMQRLGYGRDVALATGTWRGEVPFLTRDGRSVVVDLLLAIIKDAAGKPRARISIGTDVTEKKQLEEQALRAQRLDNLGLLAGGIAHDLNNALAPIMMAGPLLHQYLSDPGALRMLGIIEQSSARGAALVRQMVSFARGTGTEKQLVQVSHVLREVINLATSTFPKSIRIESHLPSDLWPVLSDPTKIQQVFLNLCVNARDAMSDGGELTLSAANRTLDAVEAAKISPNARSGDFLTVEIRDTGTGISPDVLEKIWDPFFTTKREGKGTGLGLSTVGSIVRQHDGFVIVQTSHTRKSPHGTTFTVYLPAAKGKIKSGPSAHPFESQQGNGELILVVDDEKPVCELTSKILTSHGYNVMTASDGVDAIVAFVPRAAEVRLLLTDMEMLVVSGPVLAAALRRLKPDLPIVAMSGAGSQSDETYKKFATAFLAKPFEAEALLSIVRRTLDAPPTPPT